MDKKFYVTPEMEEMKLDLVTGVLEISNGGSDPIINEEEPDPVFPIEP